MTHDEFNTLILARRLDLTGSVLSSKAREYASDADRLHNFKRAAAVLGVTPMEALVGMWVKHLVSVLDMVDRHAADGSVPIQAMVDEKFGDVVNYAILLEALMYEAMQVYAKTGPPKPEAAVLCQCLGWAGTFAERVNGHHPDCEKVKGRP